MEILAGLALFLLQFLGELVVQTVFEGLAELGLHAFRRRRPEARPAHPIVAAVGYLILGAAAGGLSLLILPDSLVNGLYLRIANLVLTPLALAVIMGVIGAWRRRRDQSLVRLDTFGYAYLFALALALVRFVWA
jgi:hypothetical protein